MGGRSLASVAGVIGCLAFATPLRAQPEVTPQEDPDSAAADADAEPATAQPSPEEQQEQQRKDQAKQHFLRGLELVKSQDWDAALAEFLASRELYSTRVAVLNAAISLQQLKRFAESMEMFNELLRDHGESLSPAEKKTVQDGLTAGKARVGEIDIEVTLPECIVIVDGNQRGTTPLPSPILVDAGTHSVVVSKEAYESYETQLTVAGRQRKLIKATLKPLAASGTLVVREASGKELDVVVDGAVVGKTPWQGRVAVGVHSVFLRGEGNLGTPPSSAQVKLNQTATLSLGATTLDSEIRVEPKPSNATVFIDGVEVGNGVWEGRLTAGMHKVEVVADGHLAFDRQVDVKSGQRELLTVALDRDLSDPMWSAGFVPHLYLELALAGAWAPGGLGGDAAKSCSTTVTFTQGDGSSGSGCRGRSSTGFMVGLRAGYALVPGLGLELTVGYLSLRERMKRRVVADGATDGPAFSSNFDDRLSMSAPLAALGASYHFFERTPLTLRATLGAARASLDTENGGNFTGADGATAYVSIPEQSKNAWVPFIAPEVAFGFEFTESMAVSVGVMAMLVFPQEVLRTGQTPTSDRAGERSNGVEFDNGDSRFVSLPSNEKALGTSLALLPNLTVHYAL